MTKLFLDDIRNPVNAVHLVPTSAQCLYQTNEGWVIVKSYSEFVEFIEANGLPELISFDHDLADMHYQIDFNDWELLTADQLGVEETGLDCAKWLVKYCEDNHCKLPEFLVHSQNPVGRQNIQTYLLNAKKHLKL